MFDMNKFAFVTVLEGILSLLDYITVQVPAASYHPLQRRCVV